MSIWLIPVLVPLVSLTVGIWTICRIFPARSRHSPRPHARNAPSHRILTEERAMTGHSASTRNTKI